MVRAGKGGHAFEDFLEQSVIAIGWNRLGDLSKVKDHDTLKTLFDTEYSDEKNRARSTGRSQLITFRFKIKKGDTVVTYDPNQRDYYLFTVLSDYKYNKNLIEDFPHIHEVKPEGKVHRDSLSVSTRNTLGAIQTIFSLNGVIDELFSPHKAEIKEEDEETTIQSDREWLRDEVLGRSHEFIKDQLLSLSWEEMQDVVSGILRAMGYRSKVSPPGSDRGKDIIASPDGLGLEKPRIRVEVKHRPKQAIDAPTVRSFLGALRQGDSGVYVATGGYTKEAHYEAERAQVPLTLVDLDELVSLLVEHYEKLDMESRALVPLVQVYWPAN